MDQRRPSKGHSTDLAEALRQLSAAEQRAARVAAHAHAQSCCAHLHIGGSHFKSKSRAACDSTVLPAEGSCVHVEEADVVGVRQVGAGDGHPHGDVFSDLLATAVRGVQVRMLVGAMVQVPVVAHESFKRPRSPVGIPARAQLARRRAGLCVLFDEPGLLFAGPRNPEDGVELLAGAPNAGRHLMTPALADLHCERRRLNSAQACAIAQAGVAPIAHHGDPTPPASQTDL